MMKTHIQLVAYIPNAVTDARVAAMRYLGECLFDHDLKRGNVQVELVQGDLEGPYKTGTLQIVAQKGFDRIKGKDNKDVLPEDRYWSERCASILGSWINNQNSKDQRLIEFSDLRYVVATPGSHYVKIILSNVVQIKTGQAS